MKKSLLLITVLAVVGLVAGCAVVPMFVESDLLTPVMKERSRRKTERIYQRGLTLCVLNPEDATEYERREHESKEPDGFRGIKFGTDISTLENMEFLRERIIRDIEGKEWKTKAYVRKNEIMRIEDEPVDRIEYFFHEGKFCYVELVATAGSDITSFNSIRRSCELQFGYPSSWPRSGEAWVWEKTIVTAIGESSIVSGAGEGDLWEREKKKSFGKVKPDATWEESKFQLKGYDFDPVVRSGPIELTLTLRIMTKEAAEHLGYKVKIEEKEKEGRF